MLAVKKHKIRKVNHNRKDAHSVQTLQMLSSIMKVFDLLYYVLVDPLDVESQELEGVWKEMADQLINEKDSAEK